MRRAPFIGLLDRGAFGRGVATVGAGKLRADTNGGATSPVTPPTITSPPALPATIETGVPFTGSPATATGADALSHRILVDGVEVGAGLSYTPVAADAGGVFVLEAIASNAGGSTLAESEDVTALYSPVVISGVTHWLTLRRSSGLAQDASVLTFPEVLLGLNFSAPSGTNAPLFNAGPPPGASFDALDDYMQHGAKAPFNFLHGAAASLVFIVTSAFDSSQYLWSSGNTSGNSTGVTMLLTATSTRLYVSNGSGTLVYLAQYNGALAPGTRMVSCTWDGVAAKIYHDKTLVFTSGAPGGAFVSADSTNLPTISNTLLETDGIIHDVISATRVLDLADITQIYDNLVAA